MRLWIIAPATLLFVLLAPVAGQAQDDGYYDSSATQDPGGGGYYDPSGYQDPNQGYGAQPAQPTQPTQPAAPPADQSGVSVSVSTEDPDAEARISGFELGINWGGGVKLAMEPGWCFGRFGIYLLAGLGYYKNHQEASTDDTQLVDPTAPGFGAAHHGAYGEYDEQVSIDVTGLTYDIGLAFRVYLLEALTVRSPALYVELGGGYRGAAFGTEVDWKFKGDEEAIGDVNGDGDVDKDDVAAQETENNQSWKFAANDINRDAEQQYDGMWFNLGIGGEYVFPGGFGIAGEVGLSLFYDTEWKSKAPYGYDDDGDTGDVDWEYEDVKYNGWELELGFYYSVALRYHF